MKRFFKTFFILTLSFFVFLPVAGAAELAGGAPLSAKNAALAAASKDTLEQSVNYLKQTVPSLNTPADRRSGYAFLAGVLEQSGNFQEAMTFYVKAAAIAAGDAEGMEKKSSEQLVLDAVRCALSGGDWATAQNYLNSSVRNSTNPSIVSYIKLYEQWALLCKAQKADEISETIAMLKTYSSLDSMKAVHPQVLLTLWHITGEETYAARLKKNFPKSLEAAVVKGEIQVLPAPFWYFVPRKSDSIPEVAGAKNTGDEGTVKAKQEKGTEKKGELSTTEKILRQQLGLFREKGNAERLVSNLKQKGFEARITEEVRPSGTKYYLVVVDENKAGTMGNELRNAGFECYPLFE